MSDASIRAAADCRHGRLYDRCLPDVLTTYFGLDHILHRWQPERRTVTASLIAQLNERNIN